MLLSADRAVPKCSCDYFWGNQNILYFRIHLPIFAFQISLMNMFFLLALRKEIINTVVNMLKYKRNKQAGKQCLEHKDKILISLI